MIQEKYVFNSLKFDNIEVAFLFVKYKTAFNIKINTSGILNDLLKIEQIILYIITNIK